MLLKNLHLDESHYISSFVSGLKDDNKPMVKMLKPNTLPKIFEVAQLQEHSVELKNKHNKPSC